MPDSLFLPAAPRDVTSTDPEKEAASVQKLASKDLRTEVELLLELVPELVAEIWSVPVAGMRVEVDERRMFKQRARRLQVDRRRKSERRPRGEPKV